MTTRKIGKKVNYIMLVFFILVTLSPLCFGETDFGELLGIQDKAKLNDIIDNAKKAINKNSADKESLKVLGMAYHNLATLKVKGASEKAVEYLKKAHKQNPDDQLFFAVLGSATGMMGRDSSNIVTKMKGANKGINMIDRAIMKDPDNVLIRMIRANMSLRLPKFFNRRKFAKVDLLHIEEIIKREPKKVSTAFNTEVHYRLGMIYKSDGDKKLAETYFKKTVDISPDSNWGKRAQKEL